MKISRICQLIEWRLESTGKEEAPMIPEFRAGHKGCLTIIGTRNVGVGASFGEAWRK